MGTSAKPTTFMYTVLLEVSAPNAKAESTFVADMLLAGRTTAERTSENNTDVETDRVVVIEQQWGRHAEHVHQFIRGFHKE